MSKQGNSIYYLLLIKTAKEERCSKGKISGSQDLGSNTAFVNTPALWVIHLIYREDMRGGAMHLC